MKLNFCTDSFTATSHGLRPVVLYGCETWSLTLKEEHTLRRIENRVLRRIFGPKRDDVIGRMEEVTQ
jgi:hypothetical protein